MNVNQVKNKNTLIIAGYLIVCLIILTILAGCLNNYGRVRRDIQIQQAFETYEVPSNYNYYFYGLRSYPYALMGLDPRYKLHSHMWRKVDANTEQFKKMVFWTWEDYDYYLYGAHIQDPDGKNIGIFYSSVWFAAVKVNKETKVVEIMPHVFLGGP